MSEPTPCHPTAQCCWCRGPLYLVRQEDRPQDWIPPAHYWCATKDCSRRQREWAIAFQAPKTGPRGKVTGWIWVYWWVPLPKQCVFLALNAKRKLLGGAAGPGKSEVARKGAHRLCMTIANMSVLLLRKTNPELERTHIRKLRKEQSELGFRWMEQAGEARYPNGAVLECGHMEDQVAVQKYLSSEYDLIIAEEAVQYDPDALMEVMSRARTSNERVKALGGPWVWLPTNPGGPSHHLLKDMCIAHTPDVERYPALAKTYNPDEWAYVHATLDDNPYIDPDYEGLSLSGLRKARYEQLRHGDWDAAEGQFFEMFSARTHARKVPVYHGAAFVEAFDWGYGAWSCWAAFFPLPDNHWHCAKCLKFRKTEPQDAAVLIKAARREIGYARPRYGVADPKIFSEDRGESIADTFGRHGVYWQPAVNRRADKEREMGWPRLASWFRFDPRQRSDAWPEGVPWLTFDPDECKYLLRTIPALLADKHNPEDVDTKLDDHGADMCRYFVMSRPPLSQETTRLAAPIRDGSWAAWKQYAQQVVGA